MATLALMVVARQRLSHSSPVIRMPGRHEARLRRERQLTQHRRPGSRIGQRLFFPLSAVLSIVANEAESDDEQGFGRSLGDAAAQEAARTGGLAPRITDLICVRRRE